uniref:Putative RNA-binding protein n=1 Tax=Trypanosoma congolense (strain IL3000) TaxID=1068625 RepID=G0UPD7_TRYCI|nr:putative RNA-binding protein [Trypanosoma congolense IL3000]
MRNLTFTPLHEENDFINKRRRDRGSEPISLIIDNTCRVYVTQIPLSRIERDGANALRAEFEAFGPVEAYKMFTDKTGRFTGAMLCTYRNPADASAAVQHMNDQTVDGSVLKVSLSRDHGVVLLHHGTGSGRHTDGDDDGKWQHDRYQDDIERDRNAPFRGRDRFGGYSFPRRGGRDDFYGRGRGYRGRGVGGRRGYSGWSVEEAFERYISSRDGVKSSDEPKEEVGVVPEASDAATVGATCFSANTSTGESKVDTNDSGDTGNPGGSTALSAEVEAVNEEQ